ncbi:MAG TPA: hypothetical protein VLB44_16135 [Kofleriaceae bacterium]|nr:hypothetical protein [Kofleriaceae bacterium]
MSYRSDHDAALARVDALELENARLADENSRLRDPTPATAESAFGKKTRIAFGMGSASLTAIVIGMFVASSQPTSHHAKAPPAVHIDLAGCAGRLAAKPLLGPKTTDPHDPTSLRVDQITLTTGCRDDIRQVLDEGVISDVERYVLTRWLGAEDDLANRVSMITTYYANDPYTLDGYSTAPQLWREYDQAYDRRQAALEEWRHVAR